MMKIVHNNTLLLLGKKQHITSKGKDCLQDSTIISFDVDLRKNTLLYKKCTEILMVSTNDDDNDDDVDNKNAQSTR